MTKNKGISSHLSKTSENPRKNGKKASLTDSDTVIHAGIQSDINISQFRRDILTWYAKNQRALPWRATSPDQRIAYHTWLSEIMLQQTTVPAVIPYFLKFTQKWPQINDLAAADDDDVMAAWAGLGYYARARNLLKCARIISTPPYHGTFPQDEKTLLSLPGIGPYTAAAITSIAFNLPASVMDGNIERIMSRINKVDMFLPAAKPVLKAYCDYFSQGRADAPGDYAQALMDIGANICTPKKPQCHKCPISNHCKLYQITQKQTGKSGQEMVAQEMIAIEDYPKKAPKKSLPIRHGMAFWIVMNDKILVHKRGAKQMLGGMMGLPCSTWDNKHNPGQIPDELLPIIAANFEMAAKDEPAGGIQIKHTFTHFHLIMDVTLIDISKSMPSLTLPPPSKGYQWIPINHIKQMAFPTLFQKIVKQYAAS